MQSRFALCALALASLPVLGLASCKDATGPTDHCFTSEGYWAINVRVSNDRVPVITWTPADCPIAELRLGRTRGTCVCGCSGGGWFNFEACGCTGCQGEEMWWIASDTAGANRRTRSANIYPPITYGIRPDSAVEGILPGGVMLWDTCGVMVEGRWAADASYPYTASRSFVVGLGLWPSVVGWRGDQGRAVR
jgi:hypothetical protein